MNRIIYIWLFITLPVHSQSGGTGISYDIAKLKHGIEIEVFDSTVRDVNKYTADNSIYTPEREFLYRFEHIDRRGRVSYIRRDDSLPHWSFVSRKNANPINTIKYISLSSMEGTGPFKTLDPDYNQTVIFYSYASEAGPIGSGELTGLIENRANVWMHPPREGYFEILELNPFPYIKTPYSTGTHWTWKLAIGDHWSNPRWKTWKGGIENRYTYEIKAEEELITPMGKLACYRVESTAESRLGKTELVSWFNKTYGFVRLHYTNIDGSQTRLELIRVNSD